MDLNQHQRFVTLEESQATATTAWTAKSRSGRPLRSRLGRHVLPERMRQKKKIVKEMTEPLREWLKEHKKNPYPTKAEKIHLQIESGMTFTQVSNWFANLRRRIKNTVNDSNADWETQINKYSSLKSGNADSLFSDILSCCMDDSDIDSLPNFDGTRDTNMPPVSVNFEDHCYSAVGAGATTPSSPELSSGSSSSSHSSAPATTSSSIFPITGSSTGAPTPNFRQHHKQLYAKHIQLSEYLARSCHKRAREESDDDEDDVTNTNNNNVDEINKVDSGRPKKYKKRMINRYLNEPEQPDPTPEQHQQPTNYPQQQIQHSMADNIQHFQQQKRHQVKQQQVASPVNRQPLSVDQFQHQKRHKAKRLTVDSPIQHQQQQQPPSQFQQHQPSVNQFQKQKRQRIKKLVTGWHSVESGSETADRSSSSTSHSPSSSDSSSLQTYPSPGKIASYTPIYHRTTIHQLQSLPNEQPPWNQMEAAIVLASLGKEVPVLE